MTPEEYESEIAALRAELAARTALPADEPPVIVTGPTVEQIDAQTRQEVAIIAAQTEQIVAIEELANDDDNDNDRDDSPGASPSPDHWYFRPMGSGR